VGEKRLMGAPPMLVFGETQVGTLRASARNRSSCRPET
jgi:hypothetical protein